MSEADAATADERDDSGTSRTNGGPRLDGPQSSGGRAGGHNGTAGPTGSRSDPTSRTPGSLGARILVTWIELLAVGFGGTILGTLAGGPVGLVAYLLTTLASVGVLLYNVAKLVDERVARADG